MTAANDIVRSCRHQKATDKVGGSLLSGDLFVKMYPDRKEPYDADIVSAKDDVIERFEITMAIDGHEESVRIEYLSEYGRADVFWPVQFNGKKGNRRYFNTDTEAYSNTDHDNKQIEIFNKTFKKKILKKDRYEDVSLLIGIDCVAKLTNSYWNEVKNTIVQEKGPFNNIYIADIRCCNHFCNFPRKYIL